MNCFLVSHNGLGDNIYMIGALHFLLTFYDNIYFLCKEKFYDNVKLFFINMPNIICVPFDDSNENLNIQIIIKKNYNDNDILICGCHKQYLTSKITNKEFINYKIDDNKNYNIDFDTLTQNTYSFIENFYKDINLNLTIFYDYFILPPSINSEKLYNTIKKYNIVFIHTESSTNQFLNISNLIKKYIYDEKTILICSDKNLYNFDSSCDIIKTKYNISNNFVSCKIVDYIDTIKQSNEIYIIDSCFTGIVLCFQKKSILIAEKIRIIRRNLTNSIII